MPETDSQPRTRRWKRTAATALLFLAGGAVVNVAVAWASCFPLAVYAIKIPPSPQGITITEMASKGIFGESQFVFDPDAPSTGLQIHRRGWPMYAFKSHTRVDYSGTEVVTQSSGGTVLLPAAYREPTLELPKVLPLKPRWLGFFGNTIFYSSLLALFYLLYNRSKFRRRRRLQRGLCPECAYPIGVSPVCTECGAAVGQD